MADLVNVDVPDRSSEIGITNEEQVIQTQENTGVVTGVVVEPEVCTPSCEHDLTHAFVLGFSALPATHASPPPLLERGVVAPVCEQGITQDPAGRRRDQGERAPQPRPPPL